MKIGIAAVETPKIENDILEALFNTGKLEAPDGSPVAPVKLDGAKRIDHGAYLGSKRETYQKLCDRAMAWNLPSLYDLRMSVPPCDSYVLVGSGPSVADHIETIRHLRDMGARVLTMNTSHDYLRRHHIRPWGHVILDAKPRVAKYVVNPHPKVKYLLAAQCHDDTFHALRRFDRYIWHASVPTDDGDMPTPKYMRDNWPNRSWSIIAGATTVGLRSIFVASRLGGCDFHVFGLDGSFRGNEMYAMPKPGRIGAQIIDFTLKSKTTPTGEVFLTDSHMSKQVEDFEEMIEKRIPDYIKAKTMRPPRLTFYGDGLLNSFAATYGFHASREMNLKWCGRTHA